MPEETIHIKRYPNRRFYSRNESKYVSLQDIEELVRNGNTVDISDSQSGVNLTRAVLTQIILDRQPDKITLFPTDMLHCIVRSNDMVAGFLRDYFQHSLTYLDYLQKHGANARGMANPMHWVKAWLDGLKPTNGSSKATPSAEATPETSTSQAEASEPAVDPIAKRMEELEERIRQLESKEE